MAPRWGGLRPEPYDPDARDADGDGIIQEQTAWERPVGTNLVDELGRAIVRGSNSGTRPRGMRVVDQNGKDVDYTPTYARPGAAPGAQRVGGATALSDHGAGSLKERGMPTVLATAAPKAGTLKERGMRDVRAAAAPPPPPPAPEPKKPDAPKPKDKKSKRFTTYYHGTSASPDAILSEGLKPSLPGAGMFPENELNEDRTGVYLTEDLDEALNYGNDVFAVLMTDDEVVVEREMGHVISPELIPSERIRRVVNVELERRRLSRERREVDQRDLPVDWKPPTIEDVESPDVLEAFAPKGVLYRFERSDTSDVRPGMVTYFSPNPEYASENGDIGMVTDQLPSRFIDIRNAEDRKKIKASIDGLLLKLDERVDKADPEPALNYRNAREDLQAALKRDDSEEATGEQLASLTLAVNALLFPDRPLQPGTGQRMVMDDLKQEALIDIEANGSYSMAYRNKPRTIPFERPDAPKPDVPEGDYRMSHQPSDDGPRAFDLTEDGGGDWSMPGDVYDNPNLYTGADATVRKETMEQLERVRGNPDGLVTVYRYAPEGREFEVGNWVSLSQTYARQHGESNPTPGGTVQSMQVPAKEVRFAGDDLAEFGWYPEAQDSKPEVKPDSKVNLPYVPAKNILEKDLSQREKRSRDDASMMARSDLSMLSPEERSLLRDYYEVETDEELLDAVIDKAIEGSRWQVRDVREGPLYVAVPERAISQVLADERLKSVFESGWSMGGDASGVRRSIEERQMGVPADLSDELRPIYGFQLHEEDGDSVTMSAASEHYGPFVLVLKSDVRERTTMTLGDSLDDNLYAVPVDGEITDLQASAAAGDLGLLRSMESVHNEWGDVLDRYDLQEGRDRDIWSEQRNYSEFQVHGGIRLEDVEEVVYPSWLKGRFDEFENVIAMLDKLGIKHGEDY